MLVRFERMPMPRPLFDSIFDFERDVDSLFDGFLGQPYGRRGRAFPAIDLSDRGKEIVLVAELPGVRKEDLKITVQDGHLLISGERKEQTLPENSSWIRSETFSGSFSRTVELPHDVKADAISAELKDGVLRVVMPKAEEALPREISIR